jgi:S-adenosylmethionine synthetase
MKRVSEVVLPGHVDALCDNIAEQLVVRLTVFRPETRAQVEASIWGDTLVLTGGVVGWGGCGNIDIEAVARQTMADVGYVAPNSCDASKMRIINLIKISELRDKDEEPLVADQCVSIGWAGYGAATNWLPPEHWLARRFAAALFESSRNGELNGHGPDGKVLVRLDESDAGWHLESVLASMVQLPGTSYIDFLGRLAGVLKREWQVVKASDPRWLGEWEDGDIRLNPHGPWVAGGPLCDNGQTGRKVVMNHYGPRVPVGGGALYGKDVRCVDRVAQSLAREAALQAVGESDAICEVVVSYGPGKDQPLDVEFRGGGDPDVVGADHWDLSRRRGRKLVVPCDPIGFLATAPPPILAHLPGTMR